MLWQDLWLLETHPSFCCNGLKSETSVTANHLSPHSSIPNSEQLGLNCLCIFYYAHYLLSWSQTTVCLSLLQLKTNPQEKKKVALSGTSRAWNVKWHFYLIVVHHVLWKENHLKSCLLILWHNFLKLFPKPWKVIESICRKIVYIIS